MPDFETVPVGTNAALKRVKKERDALAAHVDSLRERLGMCRHHACYSIGDSGPLAIQLASIRQVANEALRLEPETSLARRDLIKQAEALESLASDYASNRDVYEHCMVRAADLRIQQQGEQ